MAFNTTINTSLLTTYLIRKFIPALEDELQFQKFTTKASVPRGMGNIARWNYFSSPVVQTTALTEGTVTGNEITTLTTNFVNGTLAEYGEFITVTELESFTALPGSRAELSNRMAYGAARSIDALVRNAADTTTSDWYAGPGEGGGASATTAAVFGSDAASATYGSAGEPQLSMSAAAVIGAAAELRGNSARGIAGVKGHPNRHFACIMSTGAEQDLVQEATAGRMTWAEAVTDVPTVGNQGSWVNGYMGSIYGTACYRSQNLTTGVITTTLDENFVIAEGGLGAVSLKTADPQIFVNTASSGDVGNPYRNRHTVAWHAFFVASLIDSNRVIKLYSGTT
jgi:N4-gp56 family major capsid protein